MLKYLYIAIELRVAYTLFSIVFDLLLPCAHAQFVFVQWEFLKFNVLKGQSALFGVKPWHWSVRECVYCTFYCFLLLKRSFAIIIITYAHEIVYFN